MRKGAVALLRRPNLEPLFTTHPSEVGSTSLHGHSSPRCCVPRSHPICRQTNNFVGFERDSRLRYLCHLDFSQPIPTEVSSHSMADSRDKVHLTRHHPIHAQNFTIWSHSTAQVTSSCFASTCGDVSGRPPCFDFFVMEVHISHKFQVLIDFFVPDVTTRPGSHFFKNWPDATTRPTTTTKQPQQHYLERLRFNRRGASTHYGS